MNLLQGTRLILAALCLAALGSCASIATLDSKSDATLKAMSDKLAAADQLSFTAYRQMDSRLKELPNQMTNATIEAHVARPDRAKAIAKGGGDERHLYLAKEGGAIFSPKTGFYARFNGFPTVEQSIDKISSELDIHVPMQDFLGSNPYRNFRANSDTITHEGVDKIGGVACDHLKGTRAELEWHLWIAQSDNLPRRATITVKEFSGKDHWKADFKKWNLNPKLPAGTFEFTPPKGATEIDIVVAE